jgi:hypothetical protein
MPHLHRVQPVQLSATKSDTDLCAALDQMSLEGWECWQVLLTPPAAPPTPLIVAGRQQPQLVGYVALLFLRRPLMGEAPPTPAMIPGRPPVSC